MDDLDEGPAMGEGTVDLPWCPICGARPTGPGVELHDEQACRDAVARSRPVGILGLGEITFEAIPRVELPVPRPPTRRALLLHWIRTWGRRIEP